MALSSIPSSKLKQKGVAEAQCCFQLLMQPIDSFRYLTVHAAKLSPIHVVQLMLVDEMGLRLPGNASDAASDIVPGGLGSRKRVYLVATRWCIGGVGDAGDEGRSLPLIFASYTSFRPMGCTT